MFCGDRKTREDPRKQLKRSGDPEKGKGRWNGVAKDVPEEWWVTT